MLVRHKHILEYLSKKDDASVSELSELLNVSEVTIRSDLNHLVKEKKIIRTHGRAQLLGERVKAEYSFEIRKRQNFEQKQKIGLEAAKLIFSNDVFLLDSSSTSLALASAIRERGDLKETTAIPTGIWAAIELMGINEVNVLLPGGYLRNISGSITGLPTTEFLSGLNIKKAFLGAWGISIENGFMDSHLLEIELKKYIIQCADEIIILADGSKFGQLGLATYANLEKVTTLITDSTAPKEILKKIEKKGIEIILAE